MTNTYLAMIWEYKLSNKSGSKDDVSLLTCRGLIPRHACCLCSLLFAILAGIEKLLFPVANKHGEERVNACKTQLHCIGVILEQGQTTSYTTVGGK